MADILAALGMAAPKRGPSLRDIMFAPPTPNAAHWRRQLAGQGSLKAAPQTVSGKAEQGLSSALGALFGAGGKRLAKRAMAPINDWTPVGNAQGIQDGARMMTRGDLVSGALGAGLIGLNAIPFGGGLKRKAGATLADLLRDTTGAIRAYHGSPNAMQIDSLRPSLGGELGAGVYFTKDRDLAGGYAIPSGEDAISPYSGVLELDIEGLNIANIKREHWLAERAKEMDALRAANGGEWSGDFYSEGMRRLEDAYKARGFDGIYDDWRQGVVFPDRADRVRITGKTPR